MLSSVYSVVASRTTKYENYLETVGFESYTFKASISHAINLYTNILKRRGLIAHMVPLTQLGAKHTEGVKLHHIHSKTHWSSHGKSHSLFLLLINELLLVLKC